MTHLVWHIFVACQLILGTSARSVFDEVAPLITNIPPGFLISRYNPRLTIDQGCRPITAYDNSGAIAWTVDSGDRPLYGMIAQKTCALSSKMGQMYARTFYDVDRKSYAIMYAWLTVNFARSPAALEWQHIIVYLVQNTRSDYWAPPSPKAVWTSVSGYTENISTDANGDHAWIRQAKQPSGAGSPGLSMYFDKDGRGEQGEIYPVIDVDQRNSWSPAASAALEGHSTQNLPPCPLALDRIAQVAHDAYITPAGTYPE